MRPGSRGGGFGKPAGGGSFRPGTGQQAVGGAAFRPGSGRIGTGQRMGTGQQAAPVYAGVGMNTVVQVADRPTTQGGLGMRVKTAGPGRQVRDLSYFLEQLRRKSTQLSTEVQKLHKEVATRTEQQQQFGQLERRYEALMKEVRDQEGTLADFNLAMDKARSATDPREIAQFDEMLKQRNDEEDRAIDGIFVERQERERGVQRLEEEIAQLQQRAMDRLNSMSPDRQQLFQRLTDENRQRGQVIGEMQAELEELNSRIEAAEGQLGGDEFRDRYARTKRRLDAMSEERSQLEEELEATKLGPQEARRRLMEKVQTGSTRSKELEGELERVRALVAEKRQVSNELDQQVANRQRGAGDQDKYEILFKKDQEMTAFIDMFPERRDKELQEQSRAKETIAALLAHISKGLEEEQAMPDKEAAGEMKEDLREKQRELDASKTTEARLRQELAKKRADMSKIEEVDGRIAEELRSLRGEMDRMRRDLTVLKDLDGLKAQHDAAVGELENHRADYRSRRDASEMLLRGLRREVEGYRAQVDADEVAKDLEAVESRIRHQEQAIFSMRETVESKGREGEYRSIKTRVGELTGEINSRIQRAQNSLV